MVALAIGLWQLHITVNEVPRYIMPAPGDVIAALYTDWGTLSPSLLVTLRITFLALGIALVGGVGLAIILVQSKWIELAIFPFAVILQVTPMIAIAPLLIIYMARHAIGFADVRLCRRLLPDPLQHGGGTQERRPQSAQSLRALWR